MLGVIDLLTQSGQTDILQAIAGRTEHLELLKDSLNQKGGLGGWGPSIWQKRGMRRLGTWVKLRGEGTTKHEAMQVSWRGEI